MCLEIIPYAENHGVDSLKTSQSAGQKIYHMENILHGEDFRNELNAIFMDYANQSDRLCNHGSSQSNESFNNSVASKAKKSKYYGESESLCYREAAAGCQKNIGPSYMVDVSYSSIYDNTDN